MSERAKTITKGFLVRTRNLLILPEGYRRSRRHPLVVALHGMGMGTEEFAKLLEPLSELPVMLFLPEGPYPFEIRAAGRYRLGRAWYLYTGDDEAFVRSMRKSGRHLEVLIDRVGEEHSVDPSRVALLGFSQGGYFAGYAGIRSSKRYRGLALLGARVKEEVLGRELGRVRDLSVLLLHGRRDRAVPFESAERSFDALEAAGIDVELKGYACGHHVTAAQLRDLRSWLEKILLSDPS